MIGITIVMTYGLLAGHLNKADAQETGDTIIIDDTTYTAIEITDEDVVWVSGDD